MEFRLRKEQFIDALQNAKFTDREKAVIRAIASMPNHEISQAQLAEALNAKAGITVTANRAIGAVGERIATYLNFEPDTTPYGGKTYWFPTISLWDEEKRVWRLHDEMVEALREMGQIRTISSPPRANPFPNVMPPDRISTEIRRIKRDSTLVKEIKLLYDYRCQIKGCNYRLQLPDGDYYAEAHHLKPLGRDNNGIDVKGNVICICANHHKELDYGARELHLSDLFVDSTHLIDQSNLDYHNKCIFEHVILEKLDDPQQAEGLPAP